MAELWRQKLRLEMEMRGWPFYIFLSFFGTKLRGFSAADAESRCWRDVSKEVRGSGSFGNFVAGGRVPAHERGRSTFQPVRGHGSCETCRRLPQKADDFASEAAALHRKDP